MFNYRVIINILLQYYRDNGDVSDNQQLFTEVEVRIGGYIF